MSSYEYLLAKYFDKENRMKGLVRILAQILPEYCPNFLEFCPNTTQIFPEIDIWPFFFFFFFFLGGGGGDGSKHRAFVYVQYSISAPSFFYLYTRMSVLRKVG